MVTNVDVDKLKTAYQNYLGRIRSTASKAKESLGEEIGDIAVILGSGLGGLGNRMREIKKVLYEEIDFPRSTVEGHEGYLLLAEHAGKKVLLLKGRFHYYEGYSMLDVTFPVRVLAELGYKTLIVTNAAGGLNPEFKIGDIMMINDHISLLMPKHPLRGPNLPYGPRFLDMHKVYDEELMGLAKEMSKEIGLELKEGVYVFVQGPTYETPAEIRMLRVLGADAVGMSTVPEVIVARHSGIRVLGFSVITDVASEVVEGGVSHEEVLKVAQKASEKLEELVLRVIERI